MYIYSMAANIVFKRNSACSLLKLILQNGSGLFSHLQRFFFSNLVPFKHDITSVLTLQKLTVDGC